MTCSYKSLHWSQESCSSVVLFVLIIEENQNSNLLSLSNYLKKTKQEVHIGLSILPLNNAYFCKKKKEKRRNT